MTFLEAAVWATIRDLFILCGFGMTAAWAWKVLKHRLDTRKKDDKIRYLAAFEELEHGAVERGLWAAMLIKSRGDRDWAEALYIRARSKEIAEAEPNQATLHPDWSWIRKFQEPKWRLQFSFRQIAKLSFLSLAVYIPLTVAQAFIYYRSSTAHTSLDLTNIYENLENNKEVYEKFNIIRSASLQISAQLSDTEEPVSLIFSALGTWIPGRVAIDAIQLASGASTTLDFNMYDAQRLYSISNPVDRLKLLPWIQDRVMATTDNPLLRKKYFERIVGLEFGTVLEAVIKSETSSTLALVFLLWLAKPNFLVRREPIASP